MHFEYLPKLVCAKRIAFDLEGDVIHNVSFQGGCPGNLKAISRVVDGMTVEQVQGYFAGLTCGGKPTSCTDQLAQAVRRAFEKSQAQARNHQAGA